MPGGVDTGIVILDIDEKSLAGGRALAVAARPSGAADGQAVRPVRRSRSLGFDVVFAERDAVSGIEVLDALAQGELKDVPQFQSALPAAAPASSITTACSRQA